MGKLEAISSIIYYLLASAGMILALVAQAVRLELKVRYLERDHRDHKTETEKAWTKIDSLQSALNNLLVAIGRLEGKIDNNHNN